MDFFRSVMDAHKEFKKLRKGINENDVKSFLEKAGEGTKVSGIVRKRIIPFGVLFPEKMLSSLHDNS